MTTETRHTSKTRLLEAALHVIRAKGYTATRVEDICAEAGVTKGSFFHHFKSKEELALEAAAYWNEMTSGMFKTAAYHALPSAQERVMGYIELRKALLQGELPEFTCLMGTMVQEIYVTEPAIREICSRGIHNHAETLEADIAAAMRECGVDARWTAAGVTAKSLALHTQAVIQGAFILAKAEGGAAVAAESIDHLRRYLELILAVPGMRAQAA